MTLQLPHNTPPDKQVGHVVVSHTTHTEPWKWYHYFTFNTDHKVIGIQYLVTSFFFYLIGGLMAVALRTELATPDSDFLDPNLYNAFMTNHGTIMIFTWMTTYRGKIL
ncbi:cytochrome c oxidase subunit I [Calothrix sp. NIES-4101]|nr:cytochrome c oxidase subunit I [Calothrix sp. NIES-4101]